ncbi:MAG: NADH-quinone oxidoreductase subunit J [Chloroflexi bacterium]|nr:NADH-quinone oxidoreductase subunit J [Chloroflexota bacterium]
MLFQDVVFWVLAVVAIGGSVGVVVIHDLFRAALLLALVFIAVAGFFVLMSAEFLAVVQVLIYVGAISVLFIFAVMLTRDVRRGNLPNRLQIPAVVLPALLLAAMVFTAVVTDWNLIPDNQQARVDLVQTQSVNVVTDSALEQIGISRAEDQEAVQQAGLADLLISDFVLPFEVASVLLLAALIGALALARGREVG